jgi:phospholipid/cholesterol/gamma-HCH transport system permease protein
MNSTARTHGSSATLLREGSLLRLLGRLDHGGVAEVWHPAVDAAKEGGELVLDASGVEYVDGAGAALIAHMTELCAGRGGSLRIQGLHPSFAPLVAMYAEENRKRSAPMMPARLGFVEQIGFQAVAVATGSAQGFVAFLGGNPGRVSRRSRSILVRSAGGKRGPLPKQPGSMPCPSSCSSAS